MNYLAGTISDAGIRKKNNQDSLSYAIARYRGEDLAFLVLCDGMGGFSKGEIASAEVVTAFDDWFRRDLPALLREGFSAEALRDAWFAMAQTQNRRIAEYAAARNLRMGTTLTAALFLGERYYVIHIGDCRLYEIRQTEIRQMTRDHTVTQREIDAGNLAPELAESDPRNHILLQCIGAGRDIEPDFFEGAICPGAGYLICCDGFRHKFSAGEMLLQFGAEQNPTRRRIEKNLADAVERIKDRGEKDNITAALLVAC